MPGEPRSLIGEAGSLKGSSEDVAGEPGFEE